MALSRRRHRRFGLRPTKGEAAARGQTPNAKLQMKKPREARAGCAKRGRLLW